jgi:hypothetical protein
MDGKRKGIEVTIRGQDEGKGGGGGGYGYFTPRHE